MEENFLEERLTNWKAKVLLKSSTDIEIIQNYDRHSIGLITVSHVKNTGEKREQQQGGVTAQPVAISFQGGVFRKEEGRPLWQWQWGARKTPIPTPGPEARRARERKQPSPLGADRKMRFVQISIRKWWYRI